MSYTSKGVRWYSVDQAPWLWMCEQLFVFEVFVYYDREVMRKGLLTEDGISISQILTILYRLSKTTQTDDEGFKAFGHAWGAGKRRIGNNQFVNHMRWLVEQEILIPHPDNGGKLRVTNKYVLNLKWNGDKGQDRRGLKFDAYRNEHTTSKKAVKYSRKNVQNQSMPKVSPPFQKAVWVKPDHSSVVPSLPEMQVFTDG